MLFHNTVDAFSATTAIQVRRAAQPVNLDYKLPELQIDRLPEIPGRNRDIDRALKEAKAALEQVKLQGIESSEEDDEINSDPDSDEGSTDISVASDYYDDDFMWN